MGSGFFPISCDSWERSFMKWSVGDGSENRRSSLCWCRMPAFTRRSIFLICGHPFNTALSTAVDVASAMPQQRHFSARGLFITSLGPQFYYARFSAVNMLRVANSHCVILPELRYDWIKLQIGNKQYESHKNTTIGWVIYLFWYGGDWRALTLYDT